MNPLNFIQLDHLKLNILSVCLPVCLSLSETLYNFLEQPSSCPTFFSFSFWKRPLNNLETTILGQNYSFFLNKNTSLIPCIFFSYQNVSYFPCTFCIEFFLQPYFQYFHLHILIIIFNISNHRFPERTRKQTIVNCLWYTSILYIMIIYIQSHDPIVVCTLRCAVVKKKYEYIISQFAETCFLAVQFSNLAKNMFIKQIQISLVFLSVYKLHRRWAKAIGKETRVLIRWDPLGFRLRWTLWELGMVRRPPAADGVPRLPTFLPSCLPILRTWHLILSRPDNLHPSPPTSSWKKTENLEFPSWLSS